MKLGMLFPGQGSQSVGMLNGYGDAPEVLETVRMGSDILAQDLEKMLREGPAGDLSRTTNTQPLMLIAGYAVFRLWKACGGPDPVVMAGHSLGEYTALVAAGAIAFEDCLLLVRLRAQAMQAAVPEGKGAMAAILGLDDDSVRAACAEAACGEAVEPVNFNAPAQVVIAGHAKGAKRAVMLSVSAPFHSSMMAPAAAQLREHLASVPIRQPRIPVIHNVDITEHTKPEDIRAALVRQADHPVRWVETVRRMAERGITLCAECGPGKVLAPLAKRIDERITGVALIDRASIEQAIALGGQS
jgi:[acyl-carrier-protein] S-malonyltransferase